MPAYLPPIVFSSDKYVLLIVLNSDADERVSGRNIRGKWRTACCHHCTFPPRAVTPAATCLCSPALSQPPSGSLAASGRDLGNALRCVCAWQTADTRHTLWCSWQRGCGPSLAASPARMMDCYAGSRICHSNCTCHTHTEWQSLAQIITAFKFAWNANAV